MTELQEKRNTARHSCEGRITLLFTHSQSREFEASLLNYSAQGIGFFSHRPLAPGTTIIIRASVDNYQHLSDGVDCHLRSMGLATIKWCQEGTRQALERWIVVDGQKNNMNYIVPALKKGLQLLELFSVRQRVLTIGEVAERLEASTAGIYRTIVTLTEMHYLKKAGRKAYELGPMVLSRGFCYLATRDILNTAATRLDELRDETSASCHLAIREGIEAIFIYRAASPQTKASLS